MTDTKKHISDLIHCCREYDMDHLVISPGSRNAPLIRAFSASDIKCYSIVDERSAAFYALGMALHLQKPVGVVCTSGSALLNYGPAIAEAYYLRVPLIVFSADRPAYLIDQQDSQTIRQNLLFQNIVKESYTLPEEPSSQEERQKSADILKSAFEAALSPDFGPVHINIPLEDPLYESRYHDQTDVIMEPLQLEVPKYSQEEMDIIKGEWLKSKTKMIACGQGVRDEQLKTLLQKFTVDESVVVVTENITNIWSEGFVDRPDTILLSTDDEKKKALAPELLISFGGHIVSKQLKLLLKKYPARKHYRLDPEKKKINTYANLSRELNCSPTAFFRNLSM